MKIVCVGGGPASLYTAILMKKQDPAHRIEVFERNAADDTFGWGVVFSDRTMEGFREADPESHERITQSFRYWDDIATWYGGRCTISTGHGFCGMSRKRLLQIFHKRCLELGVVLHFQSEVGQLNRFADADLIVAADGVNSFVREQYASEFRPQVEFRKCRFCWLGTDMPLDAFTFIFKESVHGLFQVHAYPFEEKLSTFIVECRDETWRAAGLDQASEAETVRFVENLFAEHLKGHRILNNRSTWRSFPVIRNEHWHTRNLVLLGDAAHTAHFSIGSGTKLAMEDAIALTAVFREHADSPVERVLAQYEARRRGEVERLQKTAQTSLEWFENSVRYMRQHPTQFNFNLLTRSKAITWDNLALRDAKFVDGVKRWYADHVGAPKASTGKAPEPIFTPFKLRAMHLPNRVVVSPMCMYSSTDGMPNDWHLVHLGSRAVGGAGLVVAEMTAVSREARITPGCAGIYNEEHVGGWRRICDFIHAHTASKISLQLGHAGRKGSTRIAWEGIDEPLAEGGWPLLSASPIPYYDHSQIPREMHRAEMEKALGDYTRAARLAHDAGFDMLEIHMAHGYLLASFISPLTNTRTDEHGGVIENRMRFPLEVFDAVRAAWPVDKPMSARISATDWQVGGLEPAEALTVARLLKEHGCDIIDVSAGQTTPAAKPVYGRMFQVFLSDMLRHEAGVPTMTVGNIRSTDQCNTILAAGRADLCVMARELLRDPYVVMHAAERYGYPDLHWPPQYEAVKPLGTA